MTEPCLFIYGCFIYIIFHIIKNQLKNVATLGEPMYQVAKNCLYSTLISMSERSELITDQVKHLRKPAEL